MYFLAERNKLWCSNSSRDKVSVRLTQSKIYCCQKKDRMLKLHHKWSKAKKELWFFCNSFVVDGRKEKLCKIYYKQHFNCRTLKHNKQTSFLWDKTQKTFWILLVWYSWTLVLVCVSVWCDGGAVRGGDRGLVQREPGRRPDHVSVWQTCSQGTGQR